MGFICGFQAILTNAQLPVWNPEFSFPGGRYLVAAWDFNSPSAQGEKSTSPEILKEMLSPSQGRAIMRTNWVEQDFLSHQTGSDINAPTVSLPGRSLMLRNGKVSANGTPRNDGRYIEFTIDPRGLEDVSLSYAGMRYAPAMLINNWAYTFSDPDSPNFSTSLCPLVIHRHGLGSEGYLVYTIYLPENTANSSHLTIRNTITAEPGQAPPITEFAANFFDNIKIIGKAKPDVSTAPFLSEQPPVLLVGMENEFIDLELQPQGNSPFTFQWYRNERIFHSTTNDFLRIGPLSPDDSGIYYCRISNDSGNFEALPTVVTVTKKPTIGKDGDLEWTIFQPTGIDLLKVEISKNLLEWYVDGFRSDTLLRSGEMIENQIMVPKTSNTPLFLRIRAKDRDFYVDQNSQGEGNGSQERPFQTINQAARLMLPGNTCYIRPGVYREVIKPRSSGSDGAPLMFKPWGDEGEVVITGLDLIPQKNWLDVGNNLFEVYFPLNLGPNNQVFHNNQMMHLAGWPNQGADFMKKNLAQMAAGTNPQTVVNADLPDYDYSEAMIWIHAPVFWANWTTSISGYDRESQSLSINNTAPFPGPNQHVAVESAQFFLFNIKDALDSENEYYFDKDSNLISIYRPNGMPPDNFYSAKTRMYAFDLADLKYITIEGITIFAATILTNPETSHITLNRMRLLYPYYSNIADKTRAQSETGLVLLGDNIKVENSEIAYASGTGVFLNGSQNAVLNSYIHDTNSIGTFASGVELAGSENIISHCTISRAGRSLIGYPKMYRALVQNNELTEAGLLTSDLGLTYGNAIEGGNSELRFNWMHNNQGKHFNMGLYYDHGTQNIITHHNVIWDVQRSGLLINHYGYFHLVYHNTFFADEYGFRSTWGSEYEPDLYGCRFVNNFFSKAVEISADNYFWDANIVSEVGLDAVFRPTLEYEGIDAGKEIVGLIQPPSINKPDIGAYEFGSPEWRVGHNFEDPPVYNFLRSTPIHRNLLFNSAFEHGIGKDRPPWIWISEPIEIIVGNKFQGTPDLERLRIGRGSIALYKDGEVVQNVKGFIPGLNYTLSAHFRTEDDLASVVFGIRKSNGETISLSTPPNISPTLRHWVRRELTFTAPYDSSEGITVFFRNVGPENSPIFIDDCGLILTDSSVD